MAPAVCLVVLAPVIAELLPGYTRASYAFVLLPELGVWGCGALLIREAVRRAQRGWPSLVLLGIALGLAEECLIQQTSLAPLAGLAKQDYGRAFGVNWVYLLWALGWECVYVVILPIALVELTFPERRSQAWLGRRGLVVATVGFGLGSLVAWYAWTQVARTSVFHLPAYAVPAEQVVIAIAVIGLLCVTALKLLPARLPVVPRAVPPRPIVGLVVFGLAAAWSAPLVLAYGMAPWVPPLLAFLMGVGWAMGVVWLMAGWSASPTWDDGHRLAAVAGALLASMVTGYATFSGASTVDQLFKGVVDIGAVLALVVLARNLAIRGERGEAVFEQRRAGEGGEGGPRYGHH
jgi:hypothetical protein